MMDSLRLQARIDELEKLVRHYQEEKKRLNEMLADRDHVIRTQRELIERQSAMERSLWALAASVRQPANGQ